MLYHSTSVSGKSVGIEQNVYGFFDNPVSLRGCIHEVLFRLK